MIEIPNLIREKLARKLGECGARNMDTLGYSGHWWSSQASSRDSEPWRIFNLTWSLFYQLYHIFVGSPY